MGVPPHMCAHTCMHVKHDKHACLHGGGHLQFSNIFILVFHAYVCMHMHVHIYRDTAPRPPDIPHPCAPSPELEEPKSLKIISPELIKIIRICYL